MDLNLSGKVAVVTGASKGIGLAITRLLTAEGVSVTAGARDGSDELSELASHAAVHPVLVDLTTPDGPARLVDEAIRRFGGLDILVNNVGAVRPWLDGFLAPTDVDWDWALTINFLAAVRTTRAALPHLLDRSPATIVTISSVNAFLPDPTVIDYSAAKGALINFCKSLSKEFGPRGVRVNTVSPSPVGTPLWLGDQGVAATVARAGGGDPDAIAKHAAAEASTGRFTHPQEVADLVCCSPATVPATSPAPTSSLTEGWSRPCDRCLIRQEDIAERPPRRTPRREQKMNTSDLPAPREGLVLTHFLTVSDVARSRAWYADVLDGQVVLDENPCIIKAANSWIIMNPGGGPTDDKPTVTLQPPTDPSIVSSFLNVRVADIDAFYRERSERGVEFLTLPIDRGAELRCYMRDPDGYLIEVGQATGLLEGILARVDT